MRLNQNECMVLKLLNENSGQTNVKISEQVGITPQAVGKIKKKLEENGVIREYTLSVDFEKIGVNTLAVALFSYAEDTPKEQKEKDRVECLNKPNIISYCKIPEGDITHIVMYGFRNLNELEEHLQQRQEKRGKTSSLKRLYIFSNKGLIKNSTKALISSLL